MQSNNFYDSTTEETKKIALKIYHITKIKELYFAG